MYKKCFAVLLFFSAVCPGVLAISEQEFLAAFKDPEVPGDKGLGDFASLNRGEVTKRYHKLARKWHSDKAPAEKKDEYERLFKNLSEAYKAYPDKIGGGVEGDNGEFKAAYDNPANYYSSSGELRRDTSMTEAGRKFRDARAKRSRTRAAANKAWIPLTMDERLKRMREEEEPDLSLNDPEKKKRTTLSKVLDFQPQIALDAADLATFTSTDGRLLGLGSALSTVGRYADVFKGSELVRDARTEKQHDIVARRDHPVSDGNPEFSRISEASPAEFKDASALTGIQRVARGFGSADRQWGQGLITAVEQANTAFNAETILAYNKYLAEHKDEVAAKEYMKDWRKRRRRAWIMMALEAALKSGAVLAHTRRESDPNVSPPSEKDAGTVKGANALAASGALIGLLRKAYGAYIKNEHISQAQAHAERLFQGQEAQQSQSVQ